MLEQRTDHGLPAVFGHHLVKPLKTRVRHSTAVMETVDDVVFHLPKYRYVLGKHRHVVGAVLTRQPGGMGVRQSISALLRIVGDETGRDHSTQPFTDIALVQSRGIRQPVEASRFDDTAWRVPNISTDAASDSRTSPFVGRKRELRQFGAALEACAEDRTGETFLLRAEAGIGKTRLVEEIRKQAEQLGVACHCAQVLDFGMEPRTGPIPSLLRQLLFSDQAYTTDEIELHAKACLGNAWNEALHPHAARLLFRLPLTGQDSGPQENLAQEAIRLGSQQLMCGILESTCRSRPRLLVVEDIHWAGQRTLAQLADRANIVRRYAALLVITSRVESEPLDPGWRSAMHWAPLTTMDVGPLGKEQALTLAGQLSDNDTGFIHRCIERSGGNPFFLEQLLWATVSHEGTVPDSVQNLVLTRLDMLPEADCLAAQPPVRWGKASDWLPCDSLLGIATIGPMPC